MRLTCIRSEIYTNIRLDPLNLLIYSFIKIRLKREKNIYQNIYGKYWVSGWRSANLHQHHLQISYGVPNISQIRLRYNPIWNQKYLHLRKNSHQFEEKNLSNWPIQNTHWVCHCVYYREIPIIEIQTRKFIERSQKYDHEIADSLQITNYQTKSVRE